jgi:beta-glucosidase
MLRLLVILTLLSSAACAQTAATPQLAAIETRVNGLISKMTLEEKVGQLNQVNNGKQGMKSAIAAGKVGSVLNAVGAEETNRLQHIAMEKSRLHIPILFGFDVIHGHRTIFPIPLGMASTWDPASAELEARIAAQEASATGVRWTFAPMVDIARDPRWGRIAEGAGEDQILGAAVAAAYVRGFQNNDLSRPTSIAACAKHFVAYGAAEGGRDYNTVDMSERRLREVYLPPFKAAADAGAATFMSSFNTLNGVPASANHFTLRQVLKGEWKFRGFVVSDWNSVGELIPHGVAANNKDAARLALTAGVDMDMTSDSYIDHVAELVRSGAVPQSVVDDAVRRILRIKFELGLFDRPYVDAAKEKEALLTPQNLAAARAIAQKSIVLLKNDGNLLPLAKSVGSIAVIGPLADNKAEMLGNWFARGVAEEAVSALEGVRSKVGASTRVLHSKGVEVNGPSVDGIADAVNVAKEADVAVMVLGERGDMSGEAGSRANLDFPGQQQKLLEAVVATGKPVVLVIMSGRPLTISWAAEHVPAIVEAWFPGTQGGNAIADVLFGDFNPSGKLPISFPRSLGQIPVYYNHLNTGRPAGVDGKFYSGYIDAPNTPLFPFGYGLSYTKFTYSNLELTGKPDSDGKIKASVEVKNTGDRTGDEVVQLYVRDLVATVERPVKELKAFQRVTLAPGETKKVQLAVTRDQLSYWNADMRYTVEPGTFSLTIGPSSAEGLQAKFELPRAVTPEKKAARSAAPARKASGGAEPARQDTGNAR